MFMFRFALCLLACSAPQQKVDLSPAILTDFADVERMFKRGYEDAKTKKALPSSYTSTFRRGIGEIRTGPLRRQTVSHLWYVGPEASAYMAGFGARRQYQDDEEQKKYLDNWHDLLAQGRNSLTFQGTLNIYPSFGAAYAQIDRAANPADLKGVRAVLQVGKRIVQPRVQPGDLEFSDGTASNRVSIPASTSSTTTTVAAGAATDGTSTAVAVGASRSVTTNYYTIVREERYSYYSGTFLVQFNLFGPDGTPILGKDDKEFTVIVIYGSNERRATYKVDDFRKFWAAK